MNKLICTMYLILSSFLCASVAKADFVCFSTEPNALGRGACFKIAPTELRRAIGFANGLEGQISSIQVRPGNDARERGRNNGFQDLAIIVHEGANLTGTYRVFYTSEGDFDGDPSKVGRFDAATINLSDVDFNNRARSAVIVNRAFAPVGRGLY